MDYGCPYDFRHDHSHIGEPSKMILEYLTGQPFEQSWCEIKKALPEADFSEVNQLIKQRKVYKIYKGETLYYSTFNL